MRRCASVFDAPMPPLRVQHRSGVDREEKVLVPGAKLPRRSGATAGQATGGGEVRHRFLSINNQITTFLPPFLPSHLMRTISRTFWGCSHSQNSSSKNCRWLVKVFGGDCFQHGSPPQILAAISAWREIPCPRSADDAHHLLAIFPRVRARASMCISGKRVEWGRELMQPRFFLAPVRRSGSKGDDFTPISRMQERRCRRLSVMFPFNCNQRIG